MFSYTRNPCTCTRSKTSQSVQTHHQRHYLIHRESLTTAASNVWNPRPAPRATHTRAYATARFVCPQPLPSVPGLANSKALQPSPTYTCSHKHSHGRNIAQEVHRSGWEGNTHNSVKSINSFTFLRSDGKQRSTACPQPGWTQTHLLHQLTAFQKQA